MNIFKIIYWSATALMIALFLGSAGINIIQYGDVANFYDILNFPAWLIYPSAIFKILAIVAILFRKWERLKEWAYAGLFFNAIMAFSAHQMTGDGAGTYAAIAAVAVMVSRIFEEKVYPDPETY